VMRLGMVGGECSGAGKHQQQQDGGKNLLHGENLARRWPAATEHRAHPAPKQERETRKHMGTESSVN
jgi:hypothetical protein